MLDAKDYLKGTNKPGESPFRLGTISPGYSGGRPIVIFDGETSGSAKKYPYIGSYTPVSGDRVLLAIVASSYVILGKVV